MANLYLEELEIGTRSVTGPYLISQDEIVRFAKQYDPIPRHSDEQVAARPMFGGLTASGSHTIAIFILLTSQLRPDFHVLVGSGWDELRLPNAVRPGDEPDLEMTVLELRESKSKSDRGIVRNRNLMRHQKRAACEFIANYAARTDVALDQGNLDASAHLLCAHGRRCDRLPPARRNARRTHFISCNSNRGQEAAALGARLRELRWKNSAWLATAETIAGWNGFEIRNAGSGRSPVRKRSG
jgi:acyl dehydratase